MLLRVSVATVSVATVSVATVSVATVESRLPLSRLPQDLLGEATSVATLEATLGAHPSGMETRILADVVKYRRSGRFRSAHQSSPRSRRATFWRSCSAPTNRTTRRDTADPVTKPLERRHRLAGMASRHNGRNLAARSRGCPDGITASLCPSRGDLVIAVRRESTGED
jgi:hypothetical protein